MRILLALDGSGGAAIARSLVAMHPWPAGTTVEAVRVVEPVVDAIAGPGYVVDIPVHEVLDLAAVRETLESEVEPLRSAGLEVEARVEIGRAASVLLDRARALPADLLVLGSRGRGPIASMLLGSVSAEVATDAPCPVLVARRSEVHDVILAIDGTPEADAIVEAAIASPLLRGARVSIVSVAPSLVPSTGVMFSGGYGVPIGWYEEAVVAARTALETSARAAAERLTAAGLDASWAVPDGDPAATLIETADGSDADLIVVGTHGRHGLARLVLGSVARNVLLHTRASVLVLHPTGAAAGRSASEPSAD